MSPSASKRGGWKTCSRGHRFREMYGLTIAIGAQPTETRKSPLKSGAAPEQAWLRLQVTNRAGNYATVDRLIQHLPARPQLEGKIFRVGPADGRSKRNDSWRVRRRSLDSSACSGRLLQRKLQTHGRAIGDNQSRFGHVGCLLAPDKRIQFPQTGSIN